MSEKGLRIPFRRLSKIGVISLLSMLGVDFFLHAGLLASLYSKPSPFLLPPDEAFRLIPLGYASFLVLTVLLLWLMVNLEVQGWQQGLEFGLKLGFLTWGGLMLGLLSISTADLKLLLAWWVGQSVELGIGGAVVGAGLKVKSLRPILVKVLIFIIILVVLTIVMQNLGLAPAV